MRGAVAFCLIETADQNIAARIALVAIAIPVGVRANAPAEATASEAAPPSSSQRAMQAALGLETTVFVSFTWFGANDSGNSCSKSALESIMDETPVSGLNNWIVRAS